MKIREILTENFNIEASQSDELIKLALSNPYGAAGTDYDAVLNPELHKLAEMERANTASKEATPLVVTDIVDPERKPMDTTPKPNERQSAGFRGRERAKERAGLPHFPYQDYDPYFMRPDLDDPTMI